MADLVPATGAGSGPPPPLFGALTDPAGGPMLTRVRNFASQPPVRRALPWFAGTLALGATALLWATLAPAPQRTLYSQLSDAEKAEVAAALDKAAIPYQLDAATGAVTVGEDDLYKARMLVASDGALATPETGGQMLDSLPMGASRSLEGERMRAARQRDIELTIQQIDGVESVRVHLAEPERSVFVRDNLPPSASVMVKLARGRQLSDSQVTAIINLVGGSVPGLNLDAIKVIDQHGRLLSAQGAGDTDRLELQARMEEKLRQQVSALLTPMIGEGNFSSEIQLDLDMDEVTTARESYDKDGGVVRTESQAQSQSTGQPGAVGVPGVLANTPPPATAAQPGAPQGTQPGAPANGAAAPVNSDTTSTRQYELGREVAVANTSPGKIKRLSVAVALSAEAMAKAKPAEIEQLKQLVSAAVGADLQRGDQVAVVVRSFKPMTFEELPFYQTPWFAMMLRNAVALIAVLLVLLLGVRPLIKALKRDKPAPLLETTAAKRDGEAGEDGEPDDGTIPGEVMEQEAVNPETGTVDPAVLTQQLGFAQQLVRERPESAVAALRQMLGDPDSKDPSKEKAAA